MNVGQLKELLDEYGDHIEVRVLVDGRNLSDEYLHVVEVDYAVQAPELEEPAVVITVGEDAV